MKIGFIEPVYKSKKKVVYNKHMKRTIRQLGNYAYEWNNPNLGLLTTAAMAPANWEVKYLHSPIDEIDYNEKFDIIAVSGMTRQAPEMYTIAQQFRQRGVYVVIGGIHATVLPGEAAQNADTVIAGEAEDVFPRFIADYCSNKAAPVYHSRREVNITQSPIPRFDLLQRDYGAYTIQTTRGCPHECKFCAATRIFGKKYRHKTVDQVIEEVKFLKSVKKNPIIFFTDDNMFVNRPFSTELMEALIPLDIKWFALTDAAVGKDKAFLKLLFRAGCRQLLMGFESITAENIADVNESGWKAQRVKEQPEIIKNIQESGIRPFCFIILGFDRDTPGDVEKIKKFVIENKILGEFAALTPLPGSELYDEFIKSGRLLKDKSWKYYNFSDCVIQHPNFTPDQLEQAIAELYGITYSREHYARVLSTMINAAKKITATQP